jgi:transposase
VMEAITVTRLELPAGELRRHAASSRDAKVARRLLAIALVVEGRSRTEAAKTCGMERQTLRDWVHRYNAEGLAGLSNRRSRPGPKPQLTPAQKAKVAQWAEKRAWDGRRTSARPRSWISCGHSSPR